MRLLPRKNEGTLRAFDDFFDFPMFKDFPFENMSMKCDVAKKDGNYIIDMDLPGYDKSDINISLEDGYVTVEANHEDSHDEKDKEGNYIHRERSFGSCSRSFYVGDGIKEEDIKASYKNGTLTLVVPDVEVKTVENKKYISIE